MTTPQNPYQTTPQDGRPTPPNPYAAPSGAVPPQGYAAPPATGYATPPVPAKGGRGRNFGKVLGIRLVAGIVGFIVLGVGYTIYDHATGGADTAKVGDCVVNKGTTASPDVHTIACSDPSAAYKVLKVVSGSDDNACNDTPDTVVTYTQTGGQTSDVVLCLGKNA